ncbi:hypothetical protein BS78_07G004700 [Paspalum vaginatum]|nr:hypothetical protein BS78_07G004700 [Paspalum vaginatum]
MILCFITLILLRACSGAFFFTAWSLLVSVHWLIRVESISAVYWRQRRPQAAAAGRAREVEAAFTRRAG